MAKKKQVDQVDYDSMYDSEYDRWSGTFTKIEFIDPPKKENKKTGTKKKN